MIITGVLETKTFPVTRRVRQIHCSGPFPYARTSLPLFSFASFNVACKSVYIFHFLVVQIGRMFYLVDEH